MSARFDLKHRILDALAHANVGPAVLGLDISFNEHVDGSFAPHWLLHYRGHIPARLSKAQRKRLRTCFPASDLIRRPLRVTRTNDDPRAIAYTMKSDFVRRQSYEQERLGPNGPRKCRNTRGRPLRVVEAIELAIYLDRIGLRRRLLLHEAHLVIELDGSITIEADQSQASHSARSARSDPVR